MPLILPLTGARVGVAGRDRLAGSTGNPGGVPGESGNSPTSAPPSTTSHIGIELADEAGIVRPDWDIDVELEVTGPGELLGLGSGRADTTE